MKNIGLSEKIELIKKYAKNFFDDRDDIQDVYEIIINREDLLKQIDETSDQFWNTVIEKKILYIYKEYRKWPIMETEDGLLLKYQGFNNKEGHFPVLVYEKQQETAFSELKYIQKNYVKKFI